MQQLSTSEAASETLSDLFEKARKSPLIMIDGRHDLGAIISMEDFDIVRKYRAEQLLASMAALGESMRQAAAEEGISLEDLEQMLDRHNL